MHWCGGHGCRRTAAAGPTASQRLCWAAKQLKCSPAVSTDGRRPRVRRPYVAASSARRFRIAVVNENHAAVPAWRALRPALLRSAARVLIMPPDPVVHSSQPSAADSPLDVADEVDEAALAAVMRHVPLGAGVLAGAAVALLVLGYLLIYALVFLPRGSVG